MLAASTVSDTMLAAQHVARVDSSLKDGTHRIIASLPSSSSTSLASTPPRVSSRPSSPPTTPGSSSKRKSPPAQDEESTPRVTGRPTTKSPSKARKPTKKNSPTSAPVTKRSRSTRASSPHDDAGVFDFVYQPPSSRQRSQRPFGSNEGPIPRPCINASDGDVQHINAHDVIEKLRPKYKSWFRNLDDTQDTAFEIQGDTYPVVSLEYPNTRAIERYPLLVPKDPQHYNPIMELMESLEVIIKHYIPPALHKLFGTFAQDESILRDETRSGTNKDLLRVLRRAENKKDGPLFLRTLADINKLLRDYKSGALDDGGDFSKPQSEINRIDTELSGAAASERNRCRETSKSWNGVPVAVWNTILSETYQRCVGPSIPALRGYTPHSSETYGELEAVLISDIIHECNVTESTKLVDLGSGVGNVVLQASLQAGCQSYGIEIRTKLHELALKQREELEKRCRLWGVTCNDVELAEGDFRTCERTRVKLQEADVVLVNNFKFGPDLNAALSHMFLDMKEGAVVVTLNPLLPKNFSISIHTMSNPLAIFTQEEREYGRGCVSWSMVGGKYFMNTVDRAVLAEFAAKNEEKIKQFQDRVLKYQPAPPRRGRRA